MDQSNSPDPFNRFRDESLPPREDVIAAEVIQDDATALITALHQSTSKNRLPPEEYLNSTRSLWSYSEMPNLCPLCDHKFHHRDHPRWIRKSTWLLAALAMVGTFFVSVFVPPLRRIPFVDFAIAVPLILLMPKAVYYRCPRCQWNKKFIVRIGRG